MICRLLSAKGGFDGNQKVGAFSSRRERTILLNYVTGQADNGLKAASGDYRIDRIQFRNSFSALCFRSTLLSWLKPIRFSAALGHLSRAFGGSRGRQLMFSVSILNDLLLALEEMSG
jgi:hypothetical protein